MKNKEKQKLEKKQKIKKTLIKVINIVCYIVTSIVLLALLLSLFSSNKSDDSKLNIDENGNIQLVNNREAVSTDYYISGGTIAYQLNNDFEYKQQLIDDIEGVTLSLFWFYNTETNNARWVYRIARASNDSQIFVYHKVYDSETHSYVQSFLLVSINDLFSNEGLILFEDSVRYNETFKNVFKGMYRVFNFDKTLVSISYDYYNLPIDYGLTGVFNLNSTHKDNYFYYGGVLHYNTPSSNEIVNFTSFAITYQNGVTFNTDNGFFTLYRPFTYDKDISRSYVLQNVDINNLIYISNMVLTYKNFNTFSDIFIDTTIKRNYSYSIGQLYLSQRASISSVDSSYTFSFDFTSNFTLFNTFDVSYNWNLNPVYWEYNVFYRNNNESLNIHVLDTIANPIIDGDIGQAVGVDYTLRTYLNDYGEFVIYDYYVSDIQTFMATQVYVGTLFIDNSGDVGTAFDLVITALTSLLPFLSFYIFPNITIASLLLVPLVFSLVLFIFKLFKR